jgi:flagellar basal-body rod modification protein FlgD
MATTTDAVTAALGGTPKTASTSTATRGTLGKDDFLKLLTAQMANQDPTSPTDDSQMMSQMTAFSTLEQITNLATTSQTAASVSSFNQAISLIGHDVTYLAADGSTATGKVQTVTTAGGSPSLTIGGVANITPAAVVSIA